MMRRRRSSPANGAGSAARQAHGHPVSTAGAQKAVLILEQDGQPGGRGPGAGRRGRAHRCWRPCPWSPVPGCAGDGPLRPPYGRGPGDQGRHPRRPLPGDPYVQAQGPRSVLCAPMLHQGKLVGMLYLENNLTTGAFTPERLELVRVLASQAAISLENARLYQGINAEIIERTRIEAALRAVVEGTASATGDRLFSVPGAPPRQVLRRPACIRHRVSDGSKRGCAPSPCCSAGSDRRKPGVRPGGNPLARPSSAAR